MFFVLCRALVINVITPIKEFKTAFKTEMLENDCERENKRKNRRDNSVSLCQ